MDGLSIRQGQSLLDTGNTVKEMRANDLMPKLDSPADGSASFKNVLSNAINETNSMQKAADVKIQDLATGKTTNIPDLMMQVEKADIALRLMTQVRNKVIDAYQDIMKMQV
ncbi:flagellar hook-basal body complex protein FliE [soil metagenome]